MNKYSDRTLVSSLESIPHGVLTPSKPVPVDLFMCDKGNDKAAFLSMVKVLSYDYYTYSHCVNVCIYSIAIDKKLGLRDSQIEELAHGAILHDIGKVRIDPSILNKEGALSLEEFEIMKTHTTGGGNDFGIDWRDKC